MNRETVTKHVDTVTKLLTDIVEDRTVPRNIRAAVETAKNNLVEGDGGDWDVKLSTAISILDEITNDPNIPMYTRTQVWNAVSMLEMARKEL